MPIVEAAFLISNSIFNINGERRQCLRVSRSILKIHTLENLDLSSLSSSSTVRLTSPSTVLSCASSKLSGPPVLWRVRDIVKYTAMMDRLLGGSGQCWIVILESLIQI